MSTPYTPRSNRPWGEWAAMMEQEYLWCLGQRDIQKQYAGKIVILYHRQILGSGNTHREALQDARSRATASGQTVPEVSEFLYVPIPESPWIDDTIIPPEHQHLPPLEPSA